MLAVVVGVRKLVAEATEEVTAIVCKLEPFNLVNMMGFSKFLRGVMNSHLDKDGSEVVGGSPSTNLYALRMSMSVWNSLLLRAQCGFHM